VTNDEHLKVTGKELNNYVFDRTYMTFLLPGARRKCRCFMSGSAAQRKLLQLFTVAVLTSRSCILSSGTICYGGRLLWICGYYVI